LELVTHGPLYSEGSNEAEHREFRDRIAALERDLHDAMSKADYSVLNSVRSRKKSDPTETKRMLSAFAASFSNLKMVEAPSEVHP
jgi:hypothetical protein